MMKLLFKIWRRMNAAQIALLSFGVWIFLGAFMLWLPVFQAKKAAPFLDCLFISTSATCVTGLATVDIGTRFNFAGQLVVLILIQTGGLGIMTLGTLLLFMLGRKASFAMSSAAGGSFLKLQAYSLRELLKWTLVAVAAFEIAGAVMLFPVFASDEPWPRALWSAIFHSISAFCNAGFSLYPDSLIRYAGDPFLNFTVMALIIFGGLGFFVLIDLWDTLTRDPDPARKKLSLHTKIVLAMSAALILAGAAMIFIFEQSATLKGLSNHEAVLRALFQSVTSRTAGFNTIDTGKMTDEGLFITCFLMFIGGAPGSMAGGVKVTTAGVILVVVISRVRGMNRASLFGRAMSRENLESSLALVLLSMASIGAVLFTLLITEVGPSAGARERSAFLNLLFETISAFGTVGLSTGVTPGLTAAGKIAVIVMMFVGRLGPMTLVFALERRSAGGHFRYPDEHVMIG